MKTQTKRNIKKRHFIFKESKVKTLTSTLTLFFLLTLSTIAWAQDAPEYEVHVLMSASFHSGSHPRFRDPNYNDDVKEKQQEESPITFAYIKGPGVEMVFSPGPREETVWDYMGKGSFDFIDQRTLLAKIGADVDEIETVVIDTTCFELTGGVHTFPNATFVIQKKEFDAIPTTYSTPDDNEKIMQLNDAGRLEIIDGDKELAPGITAHFLGGHTPGAQFLSVNTKDGLVVLGGDGLFTYENLKYDLECSFTTGVGDQKEAYTRIRKVLGESDKLLVPGHDMDVFRRFLSVDDRIVKIELETTAVDDSHMLAISWGKIKAR